MDEWRNSIEETPPKGGYLYIIFGFATSLLLIALITAAFSEPSLIKRIPDWCWLNTFFLQPQNHSAFLLISLGCIAIALASIYSGLFKKVLYNPLVFALLFSIPFFIIRFDICYGDWHDWIDWIEQRYFMSEPLSTLIHHLAYRLLHHPFNMGARSVISFTSSLAGFFTLLVLSSISNLLFTDPRRRMFFRMTFFFSGAMLLFFGYVENTPLLIPLELLYILFMIKYLLRESSWTLLWAALTLSIASLVHGSACFVLPSIFIALVAKFGLQLKKLIKTGTVALCGYVVPIALFLVWVFFMDRRGVIGPIYGNVLGGGDGKMFVPLFTLGGFATYTMFSARHFQDIANILLVGSGCGLIIAPLFLISNIFSIGRGINPILFGYLVSRCIFMMLWNCDWGFWGDWDLMIPNALPFVLISAFAISNGMSSFRWSMLAFTILCANILVTIMFFLVLNVKVPSLISFSAIQPVFHDESLCEEEGLLTKYYLDKELRYPLPESEVSSPDQTWGKGGPIDAIDRPPFGVTWQGYLKVPYKSRYRFTIVVEDDYRLFLNGQLMGERWEGGGRHRAEKEIKLYPGLYEIRLEYFNNADYGTVCLLWECGYFDKKKLLESDFCF